MFLVLICILASLLLTECISLSAYNIYGLNASAVVYAEFSKMPRVFLNVRDGNFMASVLYSLLVAFFLSGLSSRLFDARLKSHFLRIFEVVLSIGFAVVFFNAWVTQGRGILLVIVLGVVSILAANRFNLIDLNSFLRLRCCFLRGVLIFALSWSGLILFKSIISQFLAVPVEIEVGSDLLSRLDAGRIMLWSTWIQSWFSVSLLAGHGLGFVPKYSIDGSVNHQLTPHSLPLQLFSDSGVFGVIVFVLLTCFLLKIIYRLGVIQRFAVFVWSLLVGTYLSVASVLFWPSGVWSLLIGILGLVLCISRADVDIQSGDVAWRLRRNNSRFAFLSLCIGFPMVIVLSSLKYYTFLLRIAESVLS